MTGESERDWVKRSLEGDREAFGRLVDAHQKVLYNVALRMTNDREDARDLVQTTFLKAYGSLDRFDSRHKFFSWIYRILVNETLNLLRRRRRHDAIDERQESPAPTPDQAYSRGEMADAVRCALMELQPDHREVLVLRHIAGLSHREIADAVGVPEKTVKSRLYSARQALTRVLLRRGVESV